MNGSAGVTYSARMEVVTNFERIMAVANYLKKHGMKFRFECGELRNQYFTITDDEIVSEVTGATLCGSRIGLPSTVEYMNRGILSRILNDELRFYTSKKYC